MKSVIILAILIPLMFGFLLFGSSSSGNAGYIGLKSSNKVYAPTLFAPGFLSGGASASLSFASRPIFRPTYEPVGHLNYRTAFRWNFFDP